MTQPAVAVLDAPVPDAIDQPVADEALPESPIATDVPELDGETPPETEATPEAPKPKTLEDLSDDEFETHPRFKDFLARKSESVRRQTENATAKTMRENAARVAAGQNLQQTVQANIAGLIKHIEAGNEIDPADYSNRLAGLLASNAWSYHAAQAGDVAIAGTARLFPAEHRFTQDDLAKLTTLHEDFMAGRVGLDVVVATRGEMAIEAQVAARLDAEKAKWERERSTAERDRTRTDRQRDADAIRDGQPRPTSAAAGTSAVPSNALETAPPGSPAWRAAFKAQYGFDSP